ncbi:hypothetical protein [Streptomyces sp. NBC_01353]|uniref:hypothetical protein n=1 Tax=Streptomyces sp. NBC_01353 TaxID=2903835 RepID=UPI002E326D59|nr:hypothetical protein [Streptomyces sp. NBC_01353]
MSTTDPLTVSRFDAAMEPAPEEEQIFIVGAVADDGRPVALLLDRKDRAKVGRWLLPHLTDEVEQLRARVTELEALESEMADVIAATGLALYEEEQENARLLTERHTTNESLSDAAQALRTSRDRIAELLALATVLEVPCRASSLPLQLRRSYGHADRWAICDRQGRRWTRGVGWCPETGGIADDRLRDDARFTLAEALPLARQLAFEDSHDSDLHHDYRYGRDLPEVSHTP